MLTRMPAMWRPWYPRPALFFPASTPRARTGEVFVFTLAFVGSPKQGGAPPGARLCDGVGSAGRPRAPRHLLAVACDGYKESPLLRLTSNAGRCERQHCMAALFEYQSQRSIDITATVKFSPDTAAAQPQADPASPSAIDAPVPLPIQAPATIPIQAPATI